MSAWVGWFRPGGFSPRLSSDGWERVCEADTFAACSARLMATVRGRRGQPVVCKGGCDPDGSAQPHVAPAARRPRRAAPTEDGQASVLGAFSPGVWLRPPQVIGLLFRSGCGTVRTQRVYTALSQLVVAGKLVRREVGKPYTRKARRYEYALP